MMIVSVSLVAIALTWAGTHTYGRAQMADSFSVVSWGLMIGLLMAGGFLFASLIMPVDIRQRFDVWTFLAIGGVPLATIVYAVLDQAGVQLRVLDKLLGWVIPYGLVAMGLLLGLALAAAVQKRPPIPVVTDDSLSPLSLRDE